MPRVSIEDVEPQSKNMRAADRDRFQTLVLKKLADMKKGPFRGDLALRLDLETTTCDAPARPNDSQELVGPSRTPAHPRWLGEVDMCCTGTTHRCRR